MLLCTAMRAYLADPAVLGAETYTQPLLLSSKHGVLAGGRNIADFAAQQRLHWMLANKVLNTQLLPCHTVLCLRVHMPFSW
jgi:hypothetical protein